MKKPSHKLDFLATTSPTTADTKPLLPVFPKKDSRDAYPQGMTEDRAVLSPSDEAANNEPIAVAPTLQCQDSFVLLNLDMIDEPAVRTRWHYDQTRIAVMRTSLIDHGKGNMLEGQLLPILVFKKDDGRYEIVEGLTRVKAFRQGPQSKVIKAIVLDRLSAVDAYHKSFAANESRDAMTDYDKGMSFAAALESGIFKSQKEIAEKLGVSKQLVSFLLKFGQLDEAVRDVIEQDAGKFGSAYAQELSAVQDKVSVEKAVTLAKKILEGLPQSKVKTLAANLCQTASMKAPTRRRKGSMPVTNGTLRFNPKTISLAYESEAEMDEAMIRIAADIYAEANRKIAEAFKQLDESTQHSEK